ncbi:hypothetical protein VIBHAR_02612 [Vibrio campbellii ATCC BAA-1116]|uniref:Uncharacterized protein n=1 Tax=Vibrio campbellii (strain ATCC BAA-1116) TaxID=2902295 RepID=A7MYG6_VIBC1|nr:hypothetical protein VIBHAR_02612 [Vibrio campbellii ATCC BAA-1116]
MVLVMVLLLAKQIITLYHVVQKILTKDQHTLKTKLCNANRNIMSLRLTKNILESSSFLLRG